MSDHGTSTDKLADDAGNPGDDAGATGDGGSPIEMSYEPFDVTPRDDRDDDGSGPSGRPRTRMIVLGSLLAVGLAGVAVLGTAAWRISSQRDTSLATPSEVAGLRRDDSPDAQSTAEYLRTALAADVDLDETLGAVYTDPAGKNRSVLLFGGTTLLWTPENDLDTAIGLVEDSAGPVTGLTAVATGRLGGTMKCGTTTSPDGDIAVCGWADHGSLMIAMFPNRTAAESATLMRGIRDDVQTRG
jgi:hypothetical protein